MYLFQHDKTFYYAWELLSKVILFSLSRSESSSNLSSMYLWTLNFDIFLLFCGSKYRWLSFNFSWCESLLFVTSSTRQDQRFVFSVFCVFWKLLYVLWIWMTSSKNECKSRLSHVFTLKVLDFKIMSLFFSRMLRKTGLPKRARIFLSARRMWRIWTMLWWKWRTGLHFQRQTTIPTGIDLVNIICITIIISSVYCFRPSQIVPANVLMDNAWATEINSAMEFQIVVMEVMNFDAWIADTEFLSIWDVMANQIVLMSLTNFFVLL